MTTSKAMVKVGEDEGSAVQLSTQAEMVVSRQAQEVQAAMIVAKKFPRDETAAFARIMTSCKRKSLAEVACYEYPRGGTKVTGPSIRLAEAMAQGWGNLDFGVVELEQKHRESVVMAYAWDLETNTRVTKIFQVPHVRYSKREGNQVLTDPRDIYEMVANQGARRLRACILGVIPGDVQDKAVEACEKTMTTGNEAPLIDRIRQMVVSFSEMGVKQAEIEALLMQKIDACTERDILRLRKIYQSIKDGMSKKEDHFSASVSTEDSVDTTSTKAAKLAEKLGKKEAKPEPAVQDPDDDDNVPFGELPLKK